MDIKEIQKKLLNEIFNPNDLAWEYSDNFMQRLHRGKEVNNINPEDDVENSSIDPMEFMEELHRAVHEEDDEVEIEYESGDTIILDVNVVKHLLANTTIEQIISAAEDSNYMHMLLRELYSEIIDIDPEAAEEITEE